MWWIWNDGGIWAAPRLRKGRLVEWIVNGFGVMRYAGPVIMKKDFISLRSWAR